MEGFEIVTETLAAFGTIQAVFVIGQLLPYIPQYRTIVLTRDSSGFSTHVSLVLISASLLRLLFWSLLFRLGKPFGLILIAQSLVMILSQLFLLHVCVKYSRKSKCNGEYPLWKEFGAWRSMTIYCDTHTDAYLSCFWAAASFATAFFYPSPVYFEVLGCLALFSEAVLAVPQLLKNAFSQSTEGLSSVMIWGWFIGDAMKSSYFVIKGEPVQFVAGSVIQATVDAMILAQMWRYAKQDKLERWGQV